MFALIRRRDGMTFEDFVDHWRNSHGPLIRDTPELARHIVRYEQHPRHRPDALSGSDGVDGVAVQWFHGIDDFVGFISEPAYAELIAPDERRFIDIASIEFVITDAPNVVIDGPRTPTEASNEPAVVAGPATDPAAEAAAEPATDPAAEAAAEPANEPGNEPGGGTNGGAS